MSKPYKLVIGVDVGSTTAKMTVVDPNTREILWSKYQRHETRQPECARDMLTEIGRAYPDVKYADIRMFVTGSGAGPLAEPLGAKFVQEVNAVTMAVEQLHPDVGSVVELGGQDAKIIIFKENEKTGDKQSTCSMNDKCASGTGATIDKCMLKVGMPREDIPGLVFDDSKLHHVAAKCGVFAETDIVNLVKGGIPRDEILNSLADAIVQQNLSVLTRGNTLRSKVLLLGGPNTYLPFLQECWKQRIPESWDARGYEYDKDKVDELIIVPDNAEYYAAYGAVLYGLYEADDVGVYRGLDPLKEFINYGRKAKLGENAGPGLVRTEDERDTFLAKYQIPKFEEAKLEPGQVVKGAIGLDGGSTSSKCVFVDEEGNILKKCYQLSKGNPIADMKEMFANLKAWATDQGASIEVLGFGVTGYAGDVMEKGLSADANIVETVAHMMSAVHYFGSDIDVICDIGGQDIKVLFMQNKDIKNFKLSNQCSAGNGMLLQAMADQFGISVYDYADNAFEARLSPVFSYGCAVFLDSDRVNFQKEGYAKEELLAGLALVLPKNIWQYVVQIPRMSELGTRYVLQGGTQHNKAALKAQVDYIEARVPGAKVYVHPHTGEAGAIGAAMEALRVTKRRGYSTFVGLDEAINIDYTSTNDDTTRCDFCPNNCSRTFIDTKTPDGQTARYISGFSCEKGTVEDLDALKALNAERKKRMKRYPNLVDFEAKLAFKSFYKPEPLPDHGALIDDVQVKRTLLGAVRHKNVKRPFRRSSANAVEARKKIRIGIPRVLNIWSTGPFWRTYLETLGIQKRNIVFSDETSEEMWKEGGKYGSVDPCYPGKVGQAHIHNLLFKHHEKRPLEYIFFPCITHIPTFVQNVMDTASCPVVSGTPKVLEAAFTKEIDFFAERNIEYLAPAITMDEDLRCKQMMFDTFGERLGITEDENDFAVDQAWKALNEFDATMERKGREILDEMEREDRIAVLMIGRPYHNDPGMNHGVLEEFQAMGYPILSMRSIPKDRAYLDKYFNEDLRKKLIPHPNDINDVWPENYSVNSVQKVWAAKFAARHPNVAVLDLSSFKCGHDAPTYGLIDSIIAASGSPYSALHDVDANRPAGSIKIRTKTYGHTLMLACERLEDERAKKDQLEFAIKRKRLALLEEKKKRANGHGVPLAVQREIEELREQVATRMAEIEEAKERIRAAQAKQAAEQAKQKRPSSLSVVQ